VIFLDPDTPNIFKPLKDFKVKKTNTINFKTMSSDLLHKKFRKIEGTLGLKNKILNSNASPIKVASKSNRNTKRKIRSKNYF